MYGIAMESFFLKFTRIILLISTFAFPFAAPAFVFEVKLAHYQNIMRLRYDGKSHCGDTIDVPCQVSMEFCIVKKSRKLDDYYGGTLPCLAQHQTATPLDRQLGQSDRDGSDRNLFFFDGAILNEDPKLVNPIKWNFDDSITNKDLKLIVLVRHKSVHLMDVFSWDAPSTGLPLLHGSLSPFAEDAGWVNDELTNDQTARNDHPSTFKVQMRNYCAPHYYDAANGCNVFCAPKEDSNFDCDKLTGKKVCRAGFMNPDDDCRELKNKCDSSPCLNGAECVESAEARGYLCRCADGFIGRDCQRDIDECTESSDGKPVEGVKCWNGGSCVDRVGGFECACAPGFSGQHCNSSGPCFGYCKNGGSCLLLDKAATFCDSRSCNCTCPSGLYGAQCEHDTNECDEITCEGHANCHNTKGSYECICHEGWEGDKCSQDVDECKYQNCIANCKKVLDEIREEKKTPWPEYEKSLDECILANYTACWHDDPRKRLPCNGGQCKNKNMQETIVYNDYDKDKEIGTDKGYFCVCDRGYEKDGNCSHLSSSECRFLSEEEKCLNGGICVDVPGDYYCKCPREYHGRKCETAWEGATREGSKAPYGGVPVFTLIIILATIYTLAFVMAMAWVIWLWMRRENSKTDIFFAIPNPPVSRSNSYKQVGVY